MVVQCNRFNFKHKIYRQHICYCIFLYGWTNNKCSITIALNILNNGKLLITPNHAYIGPNKIDLASSIPSGLIAMWSGASDSIPNGWLLCDGNNNTPDLRNRFIVGAGSSYSVGNTGGSDSVTITTEQLPSHNHDHTFSINMSGLSCSSSGHHTHTLALQKRASSTGAYPSIEYSSCDSPSYASAQIRNASISSTGAHTHSITGSGTLSGSISNTGSGQSHENRPPYYALCFIMKI